MKDRERGSKVLWGRELRGRAAGGLERQEEVWHPGLAVMTSSCSRNNCSCLEMRSVGFDHAYVLGSQWELGSGEGTGSRRGSWNGLESCMGCVQMERRMDCNPHSGVP